MNNEMLPTLFDNQPLQEQEVDEFRYEVLDLEDREFVQEQEYAIRTHWDRAANEIMEAGERLLLVQDRLKKANKGKHGSFVGWLRKVGLSDGSAFFSMKASTRFGNNKNFAMRSFSPSALKELTYASDEVVDQVISGEVKPTRNAIREAEKKQREAEEKAKQARLAEAKAKADAQAAQQQLLLKEASFQSEVEELTKQLQAKNKELETIATPEVEIRYVNKEVTPQSVKNTIADLQKQIADLNKDIEAEKKTAQSQLKEKEAKLKEKMEQVARLAAENDQLSEEVRVSFKERHALIQQERTKQQWREDSNGLYTYVTGFIGKVPSPLDRESFENDDRVRAVQCIEVMERAISLLREVVSNPHSHSVIVDASDIVDAEVVR